MHPYRMSCATVGYSRAFRAGGFTRGPTPGVFGEAGIEALIPLDRMDEVMRSYLSARAQAGGGMHDSMTGGAQGMGMGGRRDIDDSHLRRCERCPRGSSTRCCNDAVSS